MSEHEQILAEILKVSDKLDQIITIMRLDKELDEDPIAIEMTLSPISPLNSWRPLESLEQGDLRELLGKRVGIVGTTDIAIESIAKNPMATDGRLLGTVTDAGMRPLPGVVAAFHPVVTVLPEKYSDDHEMTFHGVEGYAYRWGIITDPK